ncbi:mannosyltransferase [Exophiala xenobiotica]|nr:mannosyltransferase [Exophiala xenobiotica]KAK5215445.1 mannosyltransferase [Exophiala xenobiotica]KAK5285163.1 mannosyltransferase [Exophiala xenobiotica]KAK5312097.1 mannosyltransferase [Exophiala xenobiotica]KAK5469975.1 mannosyltransferase [Exophiala xenobiotica]
MLILQIYWADPKSGSGIMGTPTCKDYFEQTIRTILGLQSDELFPLQDASFEGIIVKVPHDSHKIFAEEYEKKCLTNTRYHWHRFNKAAKVREAEMSM